jgi:hypothetical protein
MKRRVTGTDVAFSSWMAGRDRGEAGLGDAGMVARRRDGMSAAS